MPLRQFQDVLGALNLVFIGFMLAGVGMRLAFPLVSLEGEGYWILQTAPVTSSQVVRAKFLHALPPLLLLGGGLGLAIALLVDMSPALAFVAPVAGICSAIATTALGVGLGAAHPRFSASNPNEIPLSAGGLAYMALAFGHAVLQMLLLVIPSQRSLLGRAGSYWSTPEGMLVLGVMLVTTVVISLAALAYGSSRLARFEQGTP